MREICWFWFWNSIYSFSVSCVLWRWEICLPGTQNPSSYMQSSQEIQVHHNYPCDWTFYLISSLSNFALRNRIMLCPFIRLIVVAEKNIVYSKFPIPLINRLEKHFLNISTMLSEVQVCLAQKLEKWAEQFINTSTLKYRRCLSCFLRFKYEFIRNCIMIAVDKSKRFLCSHFLLLVYRGPCYNL